MRTLTYDSAVAVPGNQATFRKNQARYLKVSGDATDLLSICDATRLEGRIGLAGHAVGGMASPLATL